MSVASPQEENVTPHPPTPSPTRGEGETARSPLSGDGEGQGVRGVAVVCESTACLPPDLLRRYDVGVVPIPFVFGTETFLDGVNISPSEFYARLEATRTPPKTSPPTPGAYLDAWRQAADGGRDVISVTVASTVSTLQRSALLARDLAPDALAGAAVTVVDSRSAGMGQGFVALAAARAAEAGQPLDAAVAAAERVAARLKMFVTLDTLEYLARASRIPRVAALVGGLIAIKPIIDFSGGDVRPVARVRTRRRSVEELFAMMRRDVPEGARLHVAVQHARAEEEAARFAERIGTTFACAELCVTEFTPVMGGYCGPGLLGVAYYPEDEESDDDR